MRRIVIPVLFVLGCSIPDTKFEASPDGGTSDSGPSGVLSIVPSVTALNVDENGNKQFDVTLSQAPTAPLSVRIETTSTKVGISIPQLDFTETNFAQPQTVTVTGLADVDIADEITSITLSAGGVDPVMLSTTVHDTDTLALITDVAVNNIVNVNEGMSVNVHVHLSNQPSSDVSVMAILGAGPVMATPSSLVFNAQNYDMDQTIQFTATTDANIVNEDQPLTLRMGTVDKLYTLHTLDKDVLALLVNPLSISVTEQGTGKTIDVSLTKQPPADVVVTIATMNGNVTLNKSQMTFTPGNYQTNQSVLVTAPDDPDIDPDTDTLTFSTTTTNVTAVPVTVAIADNDSQQILEDAPNPLPVTENQTVTFHATLKFQPSSNITVSVTSLAGGVATATPGTLTFTPTDYNNPTAHTVTVRGTDDNNLATDSTSIRMFEASIGMTDVPVTVSDDDQQRILVSATTINIPEGTAGGFDVSLMYDPGTTVAATVMSDNSSALPASPGSLTFTTSNYSQPHHVTVNPPADTNNASETATITVSGAGAASPATVTATAMDNTVVQTWGWPMQFPGTFTVPTGAVVAYKLDVGAVANLNTFHAFVPAAAGTFKMALYTDVSNAPGTLVPNAEMLLAKVLVSGVNTSNPLATPPLLDAPVYWLAIRFSQTNAIGYAGPTQTGRQCIRDASIPAITSPWPVNFGSGSCTVDNLFNIWITTYHQ